MIVLHVRVLLKKKLLARQSVIYSFVIGREEKWLWNSFWSFFQKENWELFRKREGFGAYRYMHIQKWRSMEVFEWASEWRFLNIKYAELNLQCESDLCWLSSPSSPKSRPSGLQNTNKILHFSRLTLHSERYKIK